MEDTPIDFVVNLDQAPLSYVSPGKYTFNPSGAKTAPMKEIHDKRQITVTFAVIITSKFLPVQVIYEGKTHICLPNFDFSKCFNVPYSANHCLNTAKSIELFEQIIFPYLNDVKETFNYPNE